MDDRLDLSKSEADEAHLNRIAALSFEDVEWTAERVRAARDFLAPWNHNIRLTDDVFTAYCPDYYPGHEQIMRVVNQELHGEFGGKRVLDVGCLEAYFSIECALQGAEVLGVDSRVVNIRKCEFVKSVLEVENASFTRDDAMNVTRSRYGRFDVVLALGLLYHLDDPFTFLSEMANLCDGFAVIDSLVALPDRAQCITGWQPELSELRQLEFAGATYQVRHYREYEPGASAVEREFSTTASTDNDLSVWLTEDSLASLLRKVGFAQVSKVVSPREAENWWSDPGDGRVLLVAAKDRYPFASRIFTGRATAPP